MLKDIKIGTKVLHKYSGLRGIVIRNRFVDHPSLQCQVLTVDYGNNHEESYWSDDVLDYKTPYYMDDFEELLK